MQTQRRRRRSAIGGTAAGLAAAGLVAMAAVSTGTATPAAQARTAEASAGAASPAGTSGAQAPARPRGALTKLDREQIAQARAQGVEQVTILLVATDRASTPAGMTQLAAKLTALPGVVRFREDALGYARAKIPLARLDDVAAWPEILAIDLDVSVLVMEAGLAAQTPSAPASASGAQPAPLPPVFPPGPTTGFENAHLATRDMQAPQFIAAHPSYDGRGVTIGIIDGNPDLLLPVFRTATALDGKPVRKVADVLTSSDPFDERDPSWLKFKDDVTAAGDAPGFTYKDAAYKAPRVGAFRIAVFDERSLKSPSGVEGDFNRDGNPKGSSGDFAVLWDAAANEVWIDTDQDRDFRDERALKDYRERGDMVIVGTDNPATPLRESVAVVIQTSPADRAVYINPSFSGHGTMVAGSAAGKGFFDGAFNGVAPEAQIVSVRTGTAVGMQEVVEAFIIAARDPRVDLITAQLGTYPASPNDGLIMDVVCQRIVERWKKPILNSAGNEGPAVGTVINPAATDGVIGVGGYVGKATWAANFGATVEHDDYLANYSARGPREDGLMKPDLVAPTGGITSTPATSKGRSHAGTFELPAGYTLGGGTSQAAPMAAGAAALVISAAKQEGVKWDAARLKWALTTGARYMPRLRANDQGGGLVQVDRAWELLKSSVELPRIVVRAPVRTVTASRLPTPFVGGGLYEREGWRPGQKEERTITLTRTTGAAKPVTYTLRLTGNNGTFAAPASVTLPLNTATPIVLQVAPSSNGAHSVLLDLIDPGTSAVVSRSLHTVVASDVLSAANEFTARWDGTAARPDTAVWCVDVPPGTAVLQLSLDVAEGIVRPRVQEPNGLSPEERPGAASMGPAYMDGGKWSRAFPAPAPGVWHILIDNASDMRRRDPKGAAPLPPARFTLTARALSAAIEPGTLTLDPSRVDPATGAATLPAIAASTRQHGFIPIAAETALGSAFTKTITFGSDGKANGATVFELTVPAGTETVRAQLSGASDPAADLDVYLFDCTGKECTLKAAGAGDGAAERIEVRNPAAGRWKAVIEATRLPAGSPMTVTYDDAIQHPAFGTLRVEPQIAGAATTATTNGASSGGATNGESEKGATAKAAAPAVPATPPPTNWTNQVTVKVAADPRGSRTLVGWMEIHGQDIEAATYGPRGGTMEFADIVDSMVARKRPAPLGVAVLRVERPSPARTAAP